MRLPVATEFTRWHLTDRMLTFGRRDRPDLPHVTILWGTASGEFDIHLKWEDGRDEPYESVARLPMDSVSRVFDETWTAPWMDVVQWVIENSRTYRPGWLRKNGYVIFWVEPAEYLAWLQVQVPWRKRKYRLDLNRLASTEAVRELAEGRFYDPALLHVLPEMGVEMPADHPLQVQAVCVGRRRPKPPLTLTWFPAVDRPGHWEGIPRGAFGHRVLRLYEHFFRNVGNAVLPVMDRIHEALELEELDIDRPSEVFPKRLAS